MNWYKIAVHNMRFSDPNLYSDIEKIASNIIDDWCDFVFTGKPLGPGYPLSITNPYIGKGINGSTQKINVMIVIFDNDPRSPKTQAIYDFDKKIIEVYPGHIIATNLINSSSIPIVKKELSTTLYHEAVHVIDPGLGSGRGNDTTDKKKYALSPNEVKANAKQITREIIEYIGTNEYRKEQVMEWLRSQRSFPTFINPVHEGWFSYIVRDNKLFNQFKMRIYNDIK